MSKNKDTRLEVLKMIIANQELSRQEHVMREMERAGYHVTQATVSRDMRTLKVLKGYNEHGEYIYLLPGQRRYQRVSDVRATVTELFRHGIISVNFSDNIAVIKTLPGHASHVALDIDKSNLTEILGTVAGDDTIIAVLTERADKEYVLDHLSTFSQPKETTTPDTTPQEQTS